MSAETMSTGIPELVRLDQIRLDEDLTYKELSTLTGVNYQTLHDLLQAGTQPYDRTLNKIRRFLEKREKPATKKARKRRPS